MSSTIKLPKFCDHCGKAFIAQKTTTQFCGHTCASRAYKQRKIKRKGNAEYKTQQEKITTTLTATSDQFLITPIAGNHINLREKEFLLLQKLHSS